MEAVIQIHDLVKTYEDLNAVDHLTLDVRQGSVFSLLGPNGAGKTTTGGARESHKPNVGALKSRV